jgi:hypothetical protein
MYDKPLMRRAEEIAWLVLDHFEELLRSTFCIK